MSLNEMIIFSLFNVQNAQCRMEAYGPNDCADPIEM